MNKSTFVNFMALPFAYMVQNVQFPVIYVSDFRMEAVNLQNHLRHIHEAPPLILNEDLSMSAEKLATRLAKNEKIMQHVSKWDGLNIAKGCSKVEMSGDKAIWKLYVHSFLYKKPGLN